MEEKLTIEMSVSNPTEIAESFKKTQSVIEEVSNKALFHSQWVDEQIEMGYIPRIRSDEGHFDRLKQALDGIIIRLMDKSPNAKIVAQVRHRADDLKVFMDNLVREHEKIFNLVREMARNQRSIGKTLNELNEELQETEQSRVYDKILDTLIQQFLQTSHILSTVEIKHRPNVYVNYSPELNSYYNILLESYTNKAKRCFLCLGCWKIINIKHEDYMKQKRRCFKDKNYQLLAKVSDMVDRRAFDKVLEPIYQIQDLIHFLWFDRHKFLIREPTRILNDGDNMPMIKFMPFPLIQTETRRRNRKENGSISSIS